MLHGTLVKIEQIIVNIQHVAQCLTIVAAQLPVAVNTAV